MEQQTLSNEEFGQTPHSRVGKAGIGSDPTVRFYRRNLAIGARVGDRLNLPDSVEEVCF
jgi:hypothetical protein